MSGVLVAGLGRFGTSVAAGLVARGVLVVAIDRSVNAVSRAASTVPGARQADGTDAVALQHLRAADMRYAVVAIRSDLTESMLCTLALISLGIGEIWAAASGDRHARILSALGAHHVILPAQQAAAETALAMAGQPGARAATFSDGTMVAAVAHTTAVARDLRAAPPGLMVAVKTGSQIHPWVPGTPIPSGATVILAGPAAVVTPIVEDGQR